jgi:hypothetical protein
MKINNKEYNDKQLITAVLDTSLEIANGEEFVTIAIKRVADNKTFKKAFLKVLNDNNNKLAKEELKVFKKQVHKMQKLINKKPTQKAIFGLDAKEKPTKTYTIRLVKDDDINKHKTHTEAERGQYQEFITDKPEAKEPEVLTLADTVVNWMQDNEPDGLANPLRKGYVADIVNTSQMLIAQVNLLKGN